MTREEAIYRLKNTAWLGSDDDRMVSQDYLYRQRKLRNREEAIKILKSKMDGSVDTSYEWTEAVRMAIEALQTIDNCDQCEWCCPSDGIPTIHAVRCKDCKWYDNRDFCHNPRYGDGHANYAPPYVDEDYWCKDGERKGGDDE